MSPATSLEKQDPLSISAYIDRINAGLRKFKTRIIGEVSELTDYGGTRSYIFFKIKGEDELGAQCVLNCMMWQRNYAISGVRLQVGMEVILSGYADIFKAAGRFSFQAETVELAGEGMLKKAYDELKAKLLKEGLFDDARKRALPEFPERIGLITSKDGAAIGDFQVNLGRHGFKVRFVDSRVEGQQAIHDLLAAVRALRKEKLDVLVIVRGGGSLEALLPFNNEALVREVVAFPAPVLAGIGHERDVSLVCLASDLMVSTPSMAAQALNEPWESASAEMALTRERIFRLYERALSAEKDLVESSFDTMRSSLQAIFDQFSRVEQSIRSSFIMYRARIDEMGRALPAHSQLLNREMKALIRRTRSHIESILPPAIRLLSRSFGSMKNAIDAAERLLESNDPERQLRLGYSIVRGKSGVIKNLAQLAIGAQVTVHVQDGTFDAQVEKITKDK